MKKVMEEVRSGMEVRVRMGGVGGGREDSGVGLEGD